MKTENENTRLSENDIRPADLFKRYLELCASDAEKLFTGGDRDAIDCPACGGKKLENAFEKWGFGYRLCLECGSLFQSPRPRPADFETFYCESESSSFWANTFFPAVAEVRREKLFRPKVREIANLCDRYDFRPGLVVDIGAGCGIFLDEWRRLFPDSTTTAVEPNPDMAQTCRETGLDVVETFAENAGELAGRADLVTALEVIEHVHNPMTFCRSLSNLLAPGGRLLLTGLTVDGFDIQTLWNNSNSISPPHHINFLSIKGLEILLANVGLKDIHVFTPGKLDVDIVRNMVGSQPELLQDQRFIRTLLEKDSRVLENFQTFLKENQLSSHCWVWAKKPA